jgi:hypothetical protein
MKASAIGQRHRTRAKIYPDMPEMHVVGGVTVSSRCLGSFLGDEQDGFDHRINEDDNLYILCKYYLVIDSNEV